MAGAAYRGGEAAPVCRRRHPPEKHPRRVRLRLDPPHALCRNWHISGFTLLEVLVAFTILALMLTVLLRIFSDGFRGMSAAEAHATAALHAQAALAGVGSEIPLAVGERAGEYGDGFRWEVSIEPYLEPALTVSQRSFRLYRVFATARHASGAGAVTLSGLRIVGVEPTMPGEEEGDAGPPQ